jgi:predicted nucleic acid-binding protein
LGRGGRPARRLRGPKGARAATRAVSALLLDASVWLAALDPDDRHHPPARQLIEASPDGSPILAALDLTLYEVANVAVVRWHSPPDAERLVELVRVACPDALERGDRSRP